jgi:hypothetical protein
MSARIVVTLLIIAGIGIGVGALVFGVLLMVLGRSQETPSTIIAIGSTIFAASIASLVVHLKGGFRDLDDHDYP